MNQSPSRKTKISSISLTPEDREWRPDRTYSILDEVKGPIGHGPSSSHSIAPQRIAFHEVFEALKGIPDSALITLFNSFATTGEGHGTQRAILAGLLGYSAENPQSPQAETVETKIPKVTWRDVIIEDPKADEIMRHPNRLIIEARRGTSNVRVEALSVGGGNYVVLARPGALGLTA